MQLVLEAVKPPRNPINIDDIVPANVMLEIKGAPLKNKIAEFD